MPRFRYTAVDPKGQSLTGEIDGSGLPTVRESLRASGLRIVELSEIIGVSQPLTAAEAASIAQHLQQSTQSGLPLIGSLRAFNEEVFSRRLRRQLDRVCDALEAGQPLEAVLMEPSLRLPKSVSTIMSSGLPHAAINHLLSLSVRTAATTADLRARAFLILAYPILMVGALGGLWLFLLLYVTREFGVIFRDFGTPVSPLLSQIILLSDALQGWNWVYLAIGIPVFVVSLILYMAQLSTTRRQRLWYGIPIIGSMYRLTSLSELAKMLAVMLESHVPLPQALNWSASGTNDSDLQAYCSSVTKRLETGEDIITASQRVPGLPAHLEQMLRFAAHGPEGAPALRSMAQLLEVRTKSLSQAAMPLMEPVLLTAGVISVVFYVVLFFLPLIKLLNDLS